MLGRLLLSLLYYFVGSTYFLSNVAFLVSVPVLVFLAGYSLMKRVHFLTHLYLGLCLGLAPSAVYVALTDILRRYFSERYTAIILESTDTEIIHLLSRYESPEIVSKITVILESSSLVKFARVTPNPTFHKTIIDACIDIIRQTTVAPPPETEN